MSAFVTRFAPSPTGRLHIGHAASAKCVWDAAQVADGTALLRIEDIDTSRCKPEYTEAILEDLKWLGFEWPEPVRAQSQHFDAYAACVAALHDRGLAYRCYKTRTELAELLRPQTEGGPPVYAGAALTAAEDRQNQDAGRSFAWRLSLKACKADLGPVWNELAYTTQTATGLKQVQAIPEWHGDIVIARKDSPSAYHIAATHDDALQRVTHIIRGQDLVDAPHIQTLLQVLMGWRQPVYHHHALVLDDTGNRLSKSAGSTPLAELRQAGMSPQQIWDKIGI